MAVRPVFHTISSASSLRKGADARELFAANKARRDSALPGAVASNAALATSGAAAQSVTPLQKLSGGSRLVAPRDTLVTARLESSLASEIQVLNQASRNAGEVSAILQTAAAAVTRIDANLSRMADLADAALRPDVSDSQRAVLNSEFAELRAEIDDIAGATNFSNSAILNGANSFTAASIGANIQSADGFQAFTFDSRAGDEFAATGDSIAVAYDSTSNIFTVTNLASGLSAESQAVTSAPAAGETRDVILAEFGLTIQLNDAFSPAADITADNSFQIAGSASNQVDLSLRIGSGIAAGSDEISAKLQRVRVATLSTALQHDDILSAAGALQAAANVTSAEAALDTFKTALDAGLKRVAAAVDNLETGVSNFESANANLSDLAAAAQAIEGALHDVVADAAGAILANVNQVPDILAQLHGIDGMIPGETVGSAGAATEVSEKDEE